MAQDIKYLSVKDFVELGLLQEINRRFLHPVGLALSVTIDRDESMNFGGIHDYRDIPEGMAFADEVLGSDKARAKYDTVRKMEYETMIQRIKKLGYYIQPIPGRNT